MTPWSDIFAKLRRAVVRRGVPPDDAEDVVQEAFARLEAYTREHQVHSPDAFLMRTAINIGRDQAARRRNAPFETGSVVVEEIADRAPGAEDVLRAQERLRRARSGLEQLDELTRRSLLAQRLDGLSYKEIAAREGVSVSAIEKRVARGVLFLTKWMDGW